MKILTKFILAFAVFALLTQTLQITDPKLKKNQLTAFPNTYEAPLTAKDLASAKFEVTSLSNSLSESNPKLKLRKSEFLEVFKYSNYKLTRGEAEQIFIFADNNKDDLLDNKEWEAFIALYALPFEACSKKKMVLDEKAFKACYKGDPRTQVIEFRRRFGKTGPKRIMDIISSRGTAKINFADYIFFRRALYGWSECHSTSKYISKTSFKCAILSCIPQKFNIKLEYDSIYDAGLKVTSDRNLIEMDFITYLRTAYFVYYFVIFGQPLNTLHLEKAQFLRAIHEDRLPNNFEESEINLMYDLTINNNSMDFATFCFFFHLHKLFNKYSMSKPLALSQAEVLKLFKDEDVPKEVIFAIDNSYTNFSQPEYLEASLVLNQKRLNEKSFYSFKQDASATSHATNKKSSIKANVLDLKANDANRKVFFNIMLGLGKQYWSKEDFYRAFMISNLFVNVRDLPIYHNVGVLMDKMQSLYDEVSPPWSADQRKNYIFYKSLPKEVNIDLLSFMILENFTYKIQIHKFNTETVIEETLLKTILKDNGMQNMPDTVIDLAKKGYDALRRREFVALDVVKYTMIVHSAANEIKRTKNNFKTYKLKRNKDISRMYPTPNRREKSSPSV